MESFGAYLKSLREEKGKTLEEISDSTKIALSNLESLEKDRYDLLPPRVFVKGFIRSFVQELGEDPEEALRQFDAFTKKGELPDYVEEDHPVFKAKSSPFVFFGSSWFTIGLTAAGAISLAILILTLTTRIFWPDWDPKLRKGDVAVRQESGGQIVTRAPAGRVGESSPFSEASRAQVGKKILEIRALANTWIRIEPDSGPAEELVMAPGDVQVFTAKESFFLQTGNAGGIRLRYEGKELPPLGKVNQTLSLTLP